MTREVPERLAEGCFPLVVGHLEQVRGSTRRQTPQGAWTIDGSIQRGGSDGDVDAGQLHVEPIRDRGGDLALRIADARGPGSAAADDAKGAPVQSGHGDVTVGRLRQLRVQQALEPLQQLRLVRDARQR